MKEWKNKKANKAEEKEVDGKLKKGGGPRVEQEHARLDDIRRHVPSAPEGARQKITEAAVDFALENGLSMNVLTSRTFQFLLDTRAAAGKIDYNVPGYTTLQTSCVEDAYKNVKERVDKSLNEVATAGSVLTILADGWTGAAKPYLNVVLAGPTSKNTVDEFFVATLDASANYKTASQVVAWVAAEVRKQPEAVQAQVGHFVVDGGMGANRAFEEEVAKEFPKMHVSICVTHTVDLFFEDVLEDKSSRCMAGAADVNDVYDFSWAKVVYDRVDGITKFFTSHEKLTYFAREEQVADTFWDQLFARAPFDSIVRRAEARRGQSFLDELGSTREKGGRAGICRGHQNSNSR